MNEQTAKQTTEQTPASYQQPSTPQPINDLTLVDLYSIAPPKS